MIARVSSCHSNLLVVSRDHIYSTGLVISVSSCLNISKYMPEFLAILKHINIAILGYQLYVHVSSFQFTLKIDLR